MIGAMARRWNLSLGPDPVIGLEYPLEEAAEAEGGFEEEAAYPAFGEEVDGGQEPKGRADLASGVWTELVSGVRTEFAGGTYRWGLAPVIGGGIDRWRGGPISGAWHR